MGGAGSLRGPSVSRALPRSLIQRQSIFFGSVARMLQKAVLRSYIVCSYHRWARPLKKHFLTIIAVIAFGAVSQAGAADFPVKAPAVVPIVYTWTGFYSGLEAG